MIDQVHFENIKSLKDVTIDLSRFTVLVGPNGCGKSTILDQIDRLCALSIPEPEDVIGQPSKFLMGVEQFRRRGSKARMQWMGRSNNNIFITTLNAGNEPFSQRMSFEKSLIESFSWRALRLRFDPVAIAQPSPLHADAANLASNGFGVPTLLALIKLNKTSRLEQIEADLQKVVPQFEHLEFIPVDLGDKRGGYALSLSFRGVGAISADQVSDGTLLALGLLTAVHWHELPHLLLMDDIDHGLHLSAQYNLIKAIRKVLEIRPELQIICTTHAPVLLDSFEIEEVRVLALDMQGATHVKPLSEHPELDQWRRAMGTGELWANLGEEWVMA